MEEECETTASKTFLCFNLTRKRKWVNIHRIFYKPEEGILKNPLMNIDETRTPTYSSPTMLFLWRIIKMLWTYTLVPSGLRFLLHLASTVLDLIIAWRLVWADNLTATGVVTLSLVYVPILLTLVLKPPQPPRGVRLSDLLKWTFSLTANTMVSPILISMSLFKHFNWTIWAIQVQKPCKEVLNEYEENLPREIHSYLFLQAFTHCAPQTILQLHLLLLRVGTDRATAFIQAASVAVGVVKLAWCVASYHRYEAQVVGGRAPVLLLSPPEHNASTACPLASKELIPISVCLQGKVTALDTDSPIGEVVLFISWLLLISGRILCLVVSNEVHLRVTFIILSVHFSAILLYLLASQSTTLLDIPYRLVNAAFSLIALVEVSVRFHKTPLLYSLFFISLLVEDTFLMVFFFIYPSDKCSNGSLSCAHLGMYAYFTINSHVIGVILFGVYLARLQPSHNSLSVSSSTTSTATY